MALDVAHSEPEPLRHRRSESRVIDEFVVHAQSDFHPGLRKWVPSVSIGRHWNEPNPLALTVSQIEYQDSAEGAMRKAHALALVWIAAAQRQK